MHRKYKCTLCKSTMIVFGAKCGDPPKCIGCHTTMHVVRE